MSTETKSGHLADVWKLLEDIRDKLKYNRSASFDLFLNEVEDCEHAMAGALITSLASGMFWIDFHQICMETDQNKTYILSCSRLFEVLLRYNSVLLLGLKLLGFQQFKELFHTLFDIEMTRITLLLKTASFIPALISDLQSTLQHIFLIILHLIRTLFDINDTFDKHPLEEIGMTIALKRLFTVLGQQHTTELIEQCLEEDEEMLWQCVRLINFTICIAIQRPKIFFEQEGLLKSFFYFISMVSRAQLRTICYKSSNRTLIGDLQLLRQQEKREQQQDEEQERQKHQEKREKQQEEEQEEEQNKEQNKEQEEKESVESIKSLLLSNLYSSTTQSLFMSPSCEISFNCIRSISRFVLILTLFLRVFENTIKYVLSDNTKCLAFVLNDLMSIIIRCDIILFWNGRNKSSTSAMYILVKVIALKAFINTVDHFNETKFNNSGRLWIQRYEKDMPDKFLMPEIDETNQIKDICLYDIVSCNFEYGSLNVCFNSSCSVGSFEKKQDVQRFQSSSSNAIMQFLQRNPLNIQEPLEFPILQKCSGCFLAQYCSNACQKQDWYRHKTDCKNTKVVRNKLKE